MRKFNKVFVIALPRCATVSLCDALGCLGIRTAHLGRIYGEATGEHHHPRRLIHIYEQIARGDYDLDILRECDGLADYPACSVEVFRKLDRQYPGSLFINVRRDLDLQRWIQSVERQFVGLQLVKQGRDATEEERRFMRAMLALREMTFGQSKFDVDVYLRAYADHQQAIDEYFRGRDDLLSFADVSELGEHGFGQLCHFLDCPLVESPFPINNSHSLRPCQAFMQALQRGEIESQTGILPTTPSHAPRE